MLTGSSASQTSNPVSRLVDSNGTVGYLSVYSIYSDIEKNVNKYYFIQHTEADEIITIYGTIGEIGYKNIMAGSITDFYKRLMNKTNMIVYSNNDLIDLLRTGKTINRRSFTKILYNIIPAAYLENEDTKPEEKEIEIGKCDLDPDMYFIIDLLFSDSSIDKIISSIGLDGIYPWSRIAEAREILGKIKDIILKNGPETTKPEETINLTKELLTILPFTLDKKEFKPITTFRKYGKFYQKTEELANIYKILNIRKGQKKSGVHPYNFIVSKLETRIKPVKKTWVKNLLDICIGPGLPHMEIHKAYRIESPLSAERSKNRFFRKGARLLWHGTSAISMGAILDDGFKIMGSGGRLGNGIYFADDIRKSVSYAPNIGEFKCFFLCEVAIDDVSHRVVEDLNWNCIYPPGGTEDDSLIAVGETTRNCEYDESLGVTIEGVDVHSPMIRKKEVKGRTYAQGKEMSTGFSTKFHHTEYVVYNPERTITRYIVITKKRNTPYTEWIDVSDQI